MRNPPSSSSSYPQRAGGRHAQSPVRARRLAPSQPAPTTPAQAERAEAQAALPRTSLMGRQECEGEGRQDTGGPLSATRPRACPFDSPVVFSWRLEGLGNSGRPRSGRERALGYTLGSAPYTRDDRGCPFKPKPSARAGPACGIRPHATLYSAAVYRAATETVAEDGRAQLLVARVVGEHGAGPNLERLVDHKVVRRLSGQSKKVLCSTGPRVGSRMGEAVCVCVWNAHGRAWTDQVASIQPGPVRRERNIDLLSLLAGQTLVFVVQGLERGAEGAPPRPSLVRGMPRMLARGGDAGCG